MQKEMLLAVLKGSTVFVNYLGASALSCSACTTKLRLSYQVRSLQVLPHISLIWLIRHSAHEVASSRQHKSVSASDVLRALEQMDMGDIVPKLQAELEGTFVFTSKASQITHFAYNSISEQPKGR